MNFTCKQFGYKSCEEYYQDACLDSKILEIKTPTLFLNAADDMFSPARAFPLDKIRQSSYTAMVVTKYGGHISFCESLMPTGCNYVCRVLREYLQHVLSEIEAGGNKTELPHTSKDDITSAAATASDGRPKFF